MVAHFHYLLKLSFLFCAAHFYLSQRIFPWAESCQDILSHRSFLLHNLQHLSRGLVIQRDNLTSSRCLCRKGKQFVLYYGHFDAYFYQNDEKRPKTFVPLSCALKYSRIPELRSPTRSLSEIKRKKSAFSFVFRSLNRTLELRS